MKRYIAEEKISLHLPEQVRDEWERNRDTKLQAALNEFKAGKLPSAIPRHMQSLSTAKTYSDSINAAQKARDVLIAEAAANARLHQLDVDRKIAEIFSVAKFYSHDDVIFSKGKIRADRGNPPGKSGSYGDQYNWEMLLAKISQGDLYIVSKDGDYASSLTEKLSSINPNIFLKREWREQKSGALYIFETIKDVLTNFSRTIEYPAAPDVESGAEGQTSNSTDLGKTGDAVTSQDFPAAASTTPSDVDDPVANAPADQHLDNSVKLKAIDDLVKSSNFASTHQAIARLERYERNFQTDDVNRLAKALIENNQIRWIVEDDDVQKFYLNIFTNYLTKIEPDLQVQLIDILGLKSGSDEISDVYSKE